MSKGFIKLHRRIFENYLWAEERVYSKAEAWIDLIQLARFEASMKIINNKAIEVQRGEIAASIRFLEKRWKWGNTKVRNFLKILTIQEMITQRTTQGQTVIRLVKYEVYNELQQTDNTPNNTETTQRQHRDNTEATQIKESKEGEEIKKGKEDNKLPRFSFLKSMCEYGFEKELVQDFLKNRKTKRLSNTETAFKSLIKEIEKVNPTNKDNFLKEIVEKGWGSFKASWIKSETKKGYNGNR